MSLDYESLFNTIDKAKKKRWTQADTDKWAKQQKEKKPPKNKKAEKVPFVKPEKYTKRQTRSDAQRDKLFGTTTNSTQPVPEHVSRAKLTQAQIRGRKHNKKIRADEAEQKKQESARAHAPPPQKTPKQDRKERNRRDIDDKIARIGEVYGSKEHTAAEKKIRREHKERKAYDKRHSHVRYQKWLKELDAEDRSIAERGEKEEKKTKKKKEPKTQIVIDQEAEYKKELEAATGGMVKRKPVRSLDTKLGRREEGKKKRVKVESEAVPEPEQPKTDEERDAYEAALGDDEGGEHEDDERGDTTKSIIMDYELWKAGWKDEGFESEAHQKEYQDQMGPDAPTPKGWKDIKTTNESRKRTRAGRADDKETFRAYHHGPDEVEYDAYVAGYGKDNPREEERNVPLPRVEGTATRQSQEMGITDSALGEARGVRSIKRRQRQDFPKGKDDAERESDKISRQRTMDRALAEKLTGKAMAIKNKYARLAEKDAMTGRQNNKPREESPYGKTQSFSKLAELARLDTNTKYGTIAMVRPKKAKPKLEDAGAKGSDKYRELTAEGKQTGAAVNIPLGGGKLDGGPKYNPKTVEGRKRKPRVGAMGAKTTHGKYKSWKVWLAEKDALTGVQSERAGKRVAGTSIRNRRGTKEQTSQGQATDARHIGTPSGVSGDNLRERFHSEIGNITDRPHPDKTDSYYKDERHDKTPPKQRGGKRVAPTPQGHGLKYKKPKKPKDWASVDPSQWAKIDDAVQLERAKKLEERAGKGIPYGKAIQSVKGALGALGEGKLNPYTGKKMKLVPRKTNAKEKPRKKGQKQLDEFKSDSDYYMDAGGNPQRKDRVKDATTKEEDECLFCDKPRTGSKADKAQAGMFEWLMRSPNEREYNERRQMMSEAKGKHEANVTEFHKKNRKFLDKPPQAYDSEQRSGKKGYSKETQDKYKAIKGGCPWCKGDDPKMDDAVNRMIDNAAKQGPEHLRNYISSLASYQIEHDREPEEFHKKWLESWEKAGANSGKRINSTSPEQDETLKAEEGVGGMNMGAQRGLGHEAGYKQDSGQSAQVTEVVDELHPKAEQINEKVKEKLESMSVKSAYENYEQDESPESEPNKQQIPASKPKPDVFGGKKMYKKALIIKYKNIYKQPNI